MRKYLVTGDWSHSNENGCLSHFSEKIRHDISFKLTPNLNKMFGSTCSLNEMCSLIFYIKEY